MTLRIKSINLGSAKQQDVGKILLQNPPSCTSAGPKHRKYKPTWWQNFTKASKQHQERINGVPRRLDTKYPEWPSKHRRIGFSQKGKRVHEIHPSWKGDRCVQRKQQDQ